MLLKLAPEIPESAWIIPEPPKLNLDNAYTEGRTINTDSLLFVTAPAPITVTASEGWVLGAVNGTVTTASGGAYSINNTPVEEVTRLRTSSIRGMAAEALPFLSQLTAH